MVGGDGEFFFFPREEKKKQRGVQSDKEEGNKTKAKGFWGGLGWVGIGGV